MGYCKTDIIKAVEEWVIGENGERNRMILCRKLIDGITYEKLAEEFEMSDRQVKNIVYKWNDIIFEHIGN